MTAAILTPFQATTVVTEIFGGLSALHRAGLAHGRLNPSAVRIGTDGLVRLTDWAFAVFASPPPPVGNGHIDIADETDVAQRRDLTQAIAIASDLARNADRPSGRRHPVDAELLDVLMKLGAVEPTGAEEAYEHLRHVARRAALAMPERANAHVELAALVAAATLPGGGLSGGSRPEIAAPRRVPVPGHDRPLSGAKWHLPKRRRTIVAVISTAGVVLTLAVVAAAGPARSTLDRLLHRHSATTPTHTTAPNHAVAPGGKPRLIHTSARSAGAVAGIAAHVRPTCAPGRTCSLTIAVRLTPSTTARQVRWTVTLVDRCAGTRLTRAGGVLRAAPGATSVHGGRAIKLPARKALGVVVSTVAPARAAAAPLLLPASAKTC